MSLKEFDYKVEIRCPLYPTEEKETVLHCLSNLFPKTQWEIKEDSIVGESSYLTRFKKILKDMQIRDTARDLLKRNIEDEECSFILSKQASCNAKINFSEEDQPLGSLHVKIICSEIEALVSDLTEVED